MTDQQPAIRDDHERGRRFENMSKLPGWNDLTPEEQQELFELAGQYGENGNPARVEIERKDDGGIVVSFPGKGCSENLHSLRLKKLLATTSGRTVDARLGDLITYLASVGQYGDGVNAGLDFVKDMGAKDQAQAMLLVQAYATHDAAMRALSKINRTGTIDQAKMYGNLATKLLRTCARQFGQSSL